MKADDSKAVYHDAFMELFTRSVRIPCMDTNIQGDVSSHIATRAGASVDVPTYIIRSAVPEMPPHRILRDLRLRLGYSQRELSSLSGIDQALISRLEAGKDSLHSTCERLVGAMGGSLVMAVSFPASWRQVFEERIAARNTRWEKMQEERRLRRRERLSR
jgi:transcriptional regulator with XRE-family HTH domain